MTTLFRYPTSTEILRRQRLHADARQRACHLIHMSARWRALEKRQAAMGDLFRAMNSRKQRRHCLDEASFEHTRAKALAVWIYAPDWVFPDSVIAAAEAQRAPLAVLS